MGIFSDFGSLDEGQSDVASAITKAGKLLTCSHCGCERFYERSAQLNTAGATFLGLDWANQSARVYVCRDCGHLEWFL